MPQEEEEKGKKRTRDLPYCLLDWNPSKQNITLENLDEGANVDHTSGKLFSLTSDSLIPEESWSEMKQ